MKCPHCGMNIRDNIVECGYCGGKIAQRSENPAALPGRSSAPGGMTAKGAAPIPKGADDAEMDDEEGGGLSAYLHPGEQVLIGSLNVSVKKFFFHAYLTNQRIFLIDTQEKKLKVTAKDVPRDTIAGSIVEFSENSDPVLVLSIRSGDDEIKTMKLVFAQSGTDRSGEIDEWIALLQEAEPKKKARKPAAEVPPEPEPVDEEPGAGEYEEEPPVVTRPAKPAVRQELHPTRPVKDHERQPPVKRIVSPYKIPEEEPEPEPEPEPEVVAPPRRSQPLVRQAAEPARRPVITSSYDREIPPAKEPAAPQVRKPEVQSAMKVAMKGAVKPHGQPVAQPVRRMVTQPIRHYEPEPEPAFEPEPEPVPEVRAPQPVRRPVVAREVAPSVTPVRDEPVDSPQFCHNCGKKLPHSANFCPGCGTKLGQHRTLPHSHHPATQSDKRMTRTDPPASEQRAHRDSEDPDEDEIGEVPIPTKPPIKKAPKGSEMTILHKFLRR